MDRSNDTPISPLTASKPGPQFTLSAASINNEPIELDSTELTPEASRRRSEAVDLEAMHAKHDLDPEERKRRSQIRAELGNKRKADPAVMSNVPQEPSSTEFEKAAEGDQQKAASGTKKT